jgi:hypothetical protein
MPSLRFTAPANAVPSTRLNASEEPDERVVVSAGLMPPASGTEATVAPRSVQPAALEASAPVRFHILNRC